MYDDEWLCSDGEPVGLIQPLWHDDVEGAAAVLEEQEDDAVRGAGSLTGDDQARDADVGGVADVGEAAIGVVPCCSRVGRRSSTGCWWIEMPVVV